MITFHKQHHRPVSRFLIDVVHRTGTSPTLVSGANTASVTAVSGGGTATTNTYPITISSASSTSLTYDANGNMTSDGTNTYAWDAENRLITITYSGSGNHSDFTYDGIGRCVKIVETTAGSVTSTKQFVGPEERDGSGAVVKQFFARGQRDVSGSASYFYDKDHLGSVREMTNSSQAIVYQQSFDPYGVPTAIVSTTAPDFGYAGMYLHQRSGLNLTMFRQYSPGLGRWISRDPLGEDMGTNLYAYVVNNPISLVDPLGLADASSILQAFSAGFGPNRITALPDVSSNWDANDPANMVAAYAGAMAAVGLPMIAGAKAGAGGSAGAGATSCPVKSIGQDFGKLGKIVSVPKLSISGFSTHAVDQAISRNVSPSQILNTVRNSSVVLEQSSGRFLYLSNDAAVVLDPGGKVITTYGSANFDATIQSVLSTIGH